MYRLSQWNRGTLPFYQREKTGAHNLQGIGANFVPALLERDIIDEIMTVLEEDAYDLARKLARRRLFSWHYLRSSPLGGCPVIKETRK